MGYLRIPSREAALRVFLRAIHASLDLANTFLDRNGPHLAAAIAYYALISLIPLTLVLMFILGTFFEGSEGLETRLALAVNTVAPVSQETVRETIEVLARTRTETGILGILGLIWASTTVFSAVRKGLNTVWGVDHSRSFFRARLVDFSLTAGAGILMVVPVGLTAAAGVINEFTAALRTGSTDTDELTSRLLTFVSPFTSLAVFLLIYRYLPNTRVTFREIWPGALMATIVFEVFKGLFLWYTRSYPAYDSVYGPVGALVALLAWIYISANILLAGALVTSRYSASMSRQVEGAGFRVVAGLKAMLAARSATAKSVEKVENE